MSDLSIVIRADASHKLGIGHVMRCLSLAEEVIDRNGSVLIQTAQLPERIRKQFSSLSRCEIQELTCEAGSADDARSVVEIANRLQATWIIIDGPHFNADFLDNLQQAQASLLLIDDLAERDRIGANLLLNYHLIASKEMYPQVSEQSVCLFGPKFLLLRKSMRHSAIRQEAPQVANNIFVSMGGADPDRMLDRVLDALKLNCWEGREVVVAIGPNQQRDPKTETKQLSGNVTFVYPTNNIHDWIVRAELAIVAAGGTCYETAALDVPSLVLTRCEEHYQFMSPFEELGLGKLIPDDFTNQQIADEVFRLAHDVNARRTIQEACRKQIDGHGVERVVSEMVSY